MMIPHWAGVWDELSSVLHSFATLMWFSLIEIGVVGIAVWLTLLSFWCSDSSFDPHIGLVMDSVDWSWVGERTTRPDGKLFHHFVNECLAHPFVCSPKWGNHTKRKYVNAVGHYAAYATHWQPNKHFQILCNSMKYFMYVYLHHDFFWFLHIMLYTFYKSYSLSAGLVGVLCVYLVLHTNDDLLSFYDNRGR